MTKEAISTEHALKLALDLAIMHHSDDGYQELRQKVRRVAKAALAEQPAQQRIEELFEIFKDFDQCGPLLGMGGKRIGCVNHDCDKCKVQQQEPVCYKHGDEPKRGCAWCDKQPAQQEPVAWIDPKHLEWLAQSPDNLTGAGLAARQRSADMVSLYTSPPTLSLAQRQSRSDVKPLTDEEIDALREKHSEGRGAGWRFDFKGFARAIEAKLKENT